MQRNRTEWSTHYPVRDFPADLALVITIVAASVLAVFVDGVQETPIRLVVGLPFVLFLPGYAIVSALFPEKARTPDQSLDLATHTGGTIDRIRGEGILGVVRSVLSNDPGQRPGVTGLVRVALSFGVSIATVSILGLLLNETPFGLRLVPVMVSLSGVIVGFSVIAAYRRLQLSEAERFKVPYRRWVAGVRREVFRPGTNVGHVLNALVVLTFIFAIAGVGYAVSAPGGGGFTEFYLLTENDTGELVADGYPTELAAGQATPVVVGVNNREHEPVEYTVVVQLQRVDPAQPGGTTSASVQERDELDRFQMRLPADESWQEPYDVVPTMTGENMRLTFLLYRGSVPSDPTMANAYREVHLWVAVTEPDA